MNGAAPLAERAPSPSEISDEMYAGNSFEYENRFEKSSRLSKSCSILWRLLQCFNMLVLYGLVAMLLMEYTRIRSLESKLEAEQKHVSLLQAKIQNVESSIPNTTVAESQIEELDQKVQEQAQNINYVLSGTFTLLTCLISMFHMSSHISKMNQPMIQRKIISLLWMSPIYSVTSFISLLYPPFEGAMKIIKDFYESYCIYQFLSFMIVVLGRGSRDQAVEVLAKSADKLRKPSRLFSRFYDPPPDTSNEAKANAVITECQISAMQFVFIRPLTSIIYVVFVLSSLDKENDSYARRALRGVTRVLMENATNSTFMPTLMPTLDPSFYDSSPPLLDDSFNFTNPVSTFSPNSSNYTLAPSSPPSAESIFEEGEEEVEDEFLNAPNYFLSLPFFIALTVNFSVFLAFYGLLKFYHVVSEDLQWIRPWPKFLTIKGVVFLTFWQGLLILIFVNLEQNDNSTESASARGRRYQNILICLEMLFFSLTHWCVFPAEEWEEDYQRTQHAQHAPGIGIQDFVSDVSHIVKSGRERSKRRRRRRRANADKGGLYETPAISPGQVSFADEPLSSPEAESDFNFGRRMYDFDDDFKGRDRTMSDGSNLSESNNSTKSEDDENELI